MRSCRFLADVVGAVQGGYRPDRTWLRDGPLKWDQNRIGELTNQVRTWLTQNQANLASQAIGGASTIIEGLTGLFLALFSAIFFLAGGPQIWDWILMLVSKRQRPRVDGSGHVAWHVRGLHPWHRGGRRHQRDPGGHRTDHPSSTTRVAVGPAGVLRQLHPIIGAPIAMVIAAIVALAADGPLIASGVVVMIALIGQFEGHVLQPLVMARAVSIHPLAVALSVAAGTVLAGIVGAWSSRCRLYRWCIPWAVSGCRPPGGIR